MVMVIVSRQCSAGIDVSRSINTFHSATWSRSRRDRRGRGTGGEIMLDDLSQSCVALVCDVSLVGLERIPSAGPREERFKPVGVVGLSQRMPVDGVRLAIVEKVKLLDASDEVGLAGSIGESHASPSNLDRVVVDGAVQ